MNKPILLVLNVIMLVTMLTHGVHTGVEDGNGQFPITPTSHVRLRESRPIVGETWPLEYEAAEMMLSVCASTETAVPTPPAGPDGPSAFTLLLPLPVISDLVPLVAVHDPPTCPPDVYRAFLQVFRN